MPSVRLQCTVAHNELTISVGSEGANAAMHANLVTVTIHRCFLAPSAEAEVQLPEFATYSLTLVCTLSGG